MLTELLVDRVVAAPMSLEMVVQGIPQAQARPKEIVVGELRREQALQALAAAVLVRLALVQTKLVLSEMVRLVVMEPHPRSQAQVLPVLVEVVEALVVTGDRLQMEAREVQAVAATVEMPQGLAGLGQPHQLEEPQTQAAVEAVALITTTGRDLIAAATEAPVWLSSKCQIPLLQPSQAV
jgi:hypothetical protein